MMKKRAASTSPQPDHNLSSTLGSAKRSEHSHSWKYSGTARKVYVAGKHISVIGYIVT